ncbi:MAG: aldo/keto reductase [Ruminococcaceae bacterium]|nr:aldo/keto reductase [Oscillospiraceae bacterium]
MRTITLGKTDIKVLQNAFGALPIQRVSVECAVDLLRKAYDGGIRFFDTARMYTDSEEKLGKAFFGMREKIYIATKTTALTAEDFQKDLEISLETLQTDYIDLYQFHNPPFCPKPCDGSGLYEAAVKAKAQGKIRHIGITNHRPAVAKEAILSGLYETLQFPFCYLAGELDLEIVKLCKENDVGFIAMKALSGGLITNAYAACAWLMQFDNVLPIWGIQKAEELEEILSFNSCVPSMDENTAAAIEKDRRELFGSFCRACGYCMPCPVGIKINNCARMSQLIRRSPSAQWLSEENQAMMLNIEKCIGCGVCATRCPYGLNPPKLLKKNLEDYKQILAGNIKL